MNDPQVCVTAAGQFPAPSQAAARVCDAARATGGSAALGRTREHARRGRPVAGAGASSAACAGAMSAAWRPRDGGAGPWRVPGGASRRTTGMCRCRRCCSKRHRRKNCSCIDSGAVQACPLARFDAQVPPEHNPLTQSPSAVQVDDLHALADAQTTPPAQPLAAGVEQAPAPLQVPAGVSWPPLQERRSAAHAGGREPATAVSVAGAVVAAGRGPGRAGAGRRAARRDRLAEARRAGHAGARAGRGAANPGHAVAVRALGVLAASCRRPATVTAQVFAAVQ